MGAMGCHFGHAGCSVDIRGTTIRATGDAVSPVGALTCCGESQWCTGAPGEASAVLWGVGWCMWSPWGPWGAMENTLSLGQEPYASVLILLLFRHKSWCNLQFLCTPTVFTYKRA